MKGSKKPVDKKWESAAPAKPLDNLGPKPLGHIAFIPSYEKGRPDMHSLLTMQYRRLWFQERTLWEQRVYPPSEKQYFRRPHIKRKKRS